MVADPVRFRSPLYEALNSKRYQRQDLIRSIEEQTGRRLAVYFANAEHHAAAISQTDIAPLQDLLFDCEGRCDLDVLLQSPGGDIDSAEKLVYMIRERVASLRILVVERAKSAGTLIALAADEILMSSTSELGPIDPQVTIFAADGLHSVLIPCTLSEGRLVLRERYRPCSPSAARPWPACSTPGPQES
jgi:ClpP class serine protease